MRRSPIKKLEPVHNFGIRAALGAFRITRTTSILEEAGEQPLSQKREKATAKTEINTLTKANHHLKHYFQNDKRRDYAKKKSLPHPFPLRANRILETLGLKKHPITTKEGHPPPP
jgi:hypothetical protein